MSKRVWGGLAALALGLSVVAAGCGGGGDKSSGGGNSDVSGTISKALALTIDVRTPEL